MNRLGTKFLFLVGLFLLLFSLFVLHRAYSIARRHTEELIMAQAELALRFEKEVRNYIDSRVRPVMYDLVGSDEFVPETMSTSYVAREIFTQVQKQYPDFILKFSSDNPRNPANRAGPEELEMIRFFNENPDIDGWNGEIEIGGRNYLATFNARRMAESCLRCHGDPADAPASLLARYGDTAGFHRPVGEVIALDMVAIPTTTLSEGLQAQFARNAGIIWFGLAALALAVFLVAKLLITDRLRTISSHLRKYADGPRHDDIPRIEDRGNDEIGLLVRSFNALADRLRNHHGFLIEQIEQTREANVRLEKAENKYRNIFENARYGIFQSSPDGIFLTVNPAFARMFGYQSPSELIEDRLSLQSLCPDPEDVERMIYLLHSDRISDYEMEMRRKDGGVLWTKLDCSRISSSAEAPAHLEGTVQDVTVHKQEEEKRRKLEEQLLQAQKMESIGRLAGGIAHDFNNMLMPIVGYTDLALSSLPDDHPAATYLEPIRQAGSRASDLVRQLLALGRKQVLETKVVDLSDIVENLRKFLERTLGEDIRLKVISREKPLRVLADRGQIEQVIMNLAINARHAMPGGGELTIETDSVRLDEAFAARDEDFRPGRYLRMTVTDTGEGMSREVRELVFEPFFTTKRPEEGTGLGLAMVYGIVKQHGGHIDVYSEPGRGSTFKVYLPATEEEAAGISVVPGVKSRKGTETILVVDDEPAVRNLIVDLLEPHGYTIIGARSGEEALQVARRWNGTIDLLLTDVVMPGMNGSQLARRLLSDFPKVKVILMSGYTRDALPAKGIGDSADAFLQKPVTPSQLMERLTLVLDGEVTEG